MTGRDMLEWLKGLTEEELDFEIFATSDPETGEYQPMEKVCICKTQFEDGRKAIFMEPDTDEEEEQVDDETDNESEAPESDGGED